MTIFLEKKVDRNERRRFNRKKGNSPARRLVELNPRRLLSLEECERLPQSLDAQIHQGKTKVWNKGVSTGVERLEVEERAIDPDAIVWRGIEQQG